MSQFRPDAQRLAPLRERWSWALYDFANTIFSMNIVTLYFAVWIVTERGASNTAYSIATSLSSVAVLVAAPWIGGEPRTTEPDTTGDWRWFAWEALPVPLFTPFATFVRDFAAYASAIASISTSAPDGSADTSIVDRAG